MKKLICLVLGGHIWDYEPMNRCTMFTYIGKPFVATCTRCGFKKQM